MGIRAIEEWQAPTKVSELRSFLGLVNYYRRFIVSYSKRAAQLKNLLKRKRAVIDDPVLQLPDYTKPFEVHTDASDYAIGGVLVQQGNPVAYESRKLNETERRGPREGDDSNRIVHRGGGSRFVVKTDNVATSDFLTQNKPTPKQRRWQARQTCQVWLIWC